MWKEGEPAGIPMADPAVKWLGLPAQYEQAVAPKMLG